MKHTKLTLLLVLCLARCAAAAPDSIFINNSTLTTLTNIDATVVINRGLVYFDTISSAVINDVPFQTRDTVYFTNTGGMVLQPGAIFNSQTAAGGRSAQSFNNSGSILAVDAPPVAFWAIGGIPVPVSSQPPGAGGAGGETQTKVPGLFLAGAGTNTPWPSSLLVMASNITCSGLMEVGDLGTMQLTGSTLNLGGGSLIAGCVSDSDTNGTVGRGVIMAYYLGSSNVDVFYSPPAGVYDIAWTLGNGNSHLDDVEYIYDSIELLGEGENEIDTAFPYIGLDNGTVYGGTRNNTLYGDPLANYGFSLDGIFPIYGIVQVTGNTETVTTPAVTPNWVTYLYELEDSGTTGTTNWVDVVMVNEAFADPGIGVQVEFSEEYYNTVLENPDYLGDEYQIEPMIRFFAPVQDVITGQTVTNSIYLLDTAAVQQPAIYATNSIYAAAGDTRPLGFEISLQAPLEWTNSYAEAGIPYSYADVLPLIYASGEFNSLTVPMTNSFYVAQVGRDPEVRTGLDPYTAQLLGQTQTGMPDITNEPGTIQINSSKTNNINNLKLRANGFVNIYSTNLGGVPAAMDYGNMNLVLGSMKSGLLVSNIIPGAFHRLRGDIAAFSTDWSNLQTNDGTQKVTNYYVYHVLMVDQDLRSSFQPTGLNVSLSGNNIVLQDALQVMGNVVLQATNLTINSNFSVTGAAGNLKTANLPLVKNILIGTNGSIAASASIDLGVAASAGTVLPTKANTPILSITNLGGIASGATEIQSQIFANGGSVTAGSGALLTLNAITNLLGVSEMGLTNVLIADGDINLTSVSIQLTNSTIRAGNAGMGQLAIYATAELTDHLPNTASTQPYHTNFWQVTDGFSLPVKPASGDLYATQIKTIASNANQTVTHVWAGKDLKAGAAGFYNNEVIGHLILDRTASNATLRFSAAGSKNAMYVDYLEFQDLSFSDYHHGLVVDPNFTIYFANANVDPGKLQRVYSNIVWVPNFAGPNSTKVVEYQGFSSNCLMNAALAASTSISTDGSGTVNGSTYFPLNNTNFPNGGAIPCPSQVTSTEMLNVTNGVSGQMLMIWAEGQGSISTNLLSKNLKVGQTNSVTAVPAPGWLFAGWSGPALTNGTPAGVSNSTTLMFVTPTNVFSWLTATFITNPFIALAGVYPGLFAPASNQAGNNAGFVTFTLSRSGVFSGKLAIGATNYPFASQFNTAATATAFATNGTNRLALSFQFEGTATPGRVTGTVTNAKFDAALQAYQEPVWTSANPAPQTGTYTLVLPGNTNAAASPGGDSYGTVTVNTSGTLTASGTLADNVTFNQTIALSKTGRWPLFFVPSGVAQSVVGWVTFDTNGVGGRPQGFSGTVNWVKSAGAGTYYTNGFTNSAGLLGSAYSAAYQQTNGLALINPSISLSGGNLASNATWSVTNSTRQAYQAENKSKSPALTINASTGGFTGSYVAPGTTKTISLQGVVLQNQRQARGSFLGTNQTGEVLLNGE